MDGLRSPNRRSWTPIGETSHQLIVYHPPSHAIQVVPHPDRKSISLSDDEDTTPLSEQPLPLELAGHSSSCALCGRPWPTSPTSDSVTPTLDEPGQSNYFRVLEQAHEFSRPGTPVPTDEYRRESDFIEETDLPAKGYYERFFKEDSRLGIGAEGSVYLATHVISGSELGRYAVKKIAVGDSKAYLVRMLREVRLLESLRHPNIIPYYHSWVDETRFSSFGPPILALHVLMMYASAGNLDAFLLSRSHGAASSSPLSARDVLDADTENMALLPKAERIKAFKRRRQSERPGQRPSETRGVHLLGLDEISKLLADVVEGLAFLHENSILHLDLKCSNVLLHWEEGQVTPKALLSDFGTSEEMLRGRRERTGHTGTMEYMAPETLVTDVTGNWRPSDSHADMWSLGIILHRMLFLLSPYKNPEDLSELHNEIIHYQGYRATPETLEACERRHIPKSLLLLLERLLHLSPEQRPSAERVKEAVEEFGRRATGRSWKPWGRAKAADPKRQRPKRQPSELSPVRAILALPPVETDEPPVAVLPLADSNLPVSFTLPDLHIVIFVIKIMSLQVGLVVPLWVSAGLSAIALWELLSGPQSGAITASLGVVHAGLLLSSRLR